MKLNAAVSKLHGGILIVVLTLLALPSSAAASHLNKNAIISESETTYNNVAASHIQQFLTDKGSQLASYTIPVDFNVYYPIAQGQWDVVSVRQEWSGEIYHGKTVAQLITEFATTNLPDRAPSSPGQINPVVALATMDKESASVTGSYRTNIVSDRPITMSWLMGYGFDGKMDGCIKYGDCDVNYNRQRAIWYGGPGQQIAEGVSALKRWSTNPTKLNSCGDTWHRMSIGGECLNLENGISYALYRYTPNFSGNELFLNLYNSIKATFPYPSQSGISGANDTNRYTLQTYNGSVSILGTKRSDRRVYFNGQLIADTGTTKWEITLKPGIGVSNYAIEYRTTDGATEASKPIVITRHGLGDINGDGKVDLLDLSLLSTYWGHTDPANLMANLNPDSDNEVNILDLSLLAANWNG